MRAHGTLLPWAFFVGATVHSFTPYRKGSTTQLGQLLYVQSYFSEREDFSLFTAGKTITVQIPTTNLVNPAAIKTFARFRDRVLAQMKKVTHAKD